VSNWNPDPGQQPYGQQPGPSPYGGQGQSPYGQGDPYGQNPYGQNPYGQNPYTPSAAANGKRPGSVTAAIILSYIGSGLALLGCLLLFAMAGADSFIEGFQEAAGGGINDDDVTLFMRIVTAPGVILSIAAIIATVFVAKRRKWARILLTVLASFSIVLSIVFLPIGIVWMGLCIAGIVTLFQRSASDWFRGSGPIHGVPGYGGPQQGDPYGGQQYGQQGQQYGQQPGYGSSPQGGGDQPPSQKPWG